jgi:hypothetical protein
LKGKSNRNHFFGAIFGAGQEHQITDSILSAYSGSQILFSLAARSFVAGQIPLLIVNWSCLPGSFDQVVAIRISGSTRCDEGIEKMDLDEEHCSRKRQPDQLPAPAGFSGGMK